MSDQITFIECQILRFFRCFIADEREFRLSSDTRGDVAVASSMVEVQTAIW